MPDWTLKLEVAFDTDPADEPGGGAWTDLSSRLDGAVNITLGAGRLQDSAQGTATVDLDNNDRAIDPTNSSATYNLVPMRHARITATVGVTTYPLFRGFVDAWPPSWSNFESRVTLRLVDGFAWIGLQDADLDLASQLSSARVTALLDEADWPAGLRDIDTGIVTVEAYEQVSANLYRTLLDTADAEDADLYCAADGKVTFKNRHARFDRSSVATFGEGGIPFTTVNPAWDTAHLTNIARVELEDGDVYETIDDASVTAYGPRVMPTRDLPLRPAEAEGIAQWQIYRFADPNLWFDGMTFANVNATQLGTLLPLDVGDLVTVAHTPPAGAAVSVAKGVERIVHSIKDRKWNVTLDLSPDFGQGPWLKLDDATLGLLDGDNMLAP